MRCRNFCWLSSLLLWASVAMAQPPGIDSIYLFTQFGGSVTQSIPLDGGDVILSGYQSNSFRADDWQIMRMTPQRELLWRRTIASLAYPEREKFVIDNEFLVAVGRVAVFIDSNSYTAHDVILRYSLDGDSLWVREFNDPINFESVVSIAADGRGGYYALGTKAMLMDETYNFQVWLFKLDATGATVWERFIGDEHSDQAGDIVKLSGDSLLFSMFSTVGLFTYERFVWTNLAGDSLTSVTFDSEGNSYSPNGARLLPRGDGWEHVWTYPFNNDEDELHYLRTDYLGNVRFQHVAYAPQNAIQDFMQTPDGLVTVGYSPFGDMEARDIVLGRLNESGLWYYVEPVPFPRMQNAIGFDMSRTDVMAVLGTTQTSDTTYAACIFYLHENLHDSYLFAQPSRLNFGVVPLGEERLQAIGLAVSGDSLAVLSDFAFPDYLATNLQVPQNMVPGETLWFDIGFRADELREYVDTLVLHSDARNPELRIPLWASAPFPVCTPALRVVNFFWAMVGDSARRPLAIRNEGTTPLHIEPLVEQPPFLLDSLGPFVVGPDSEAVLWFEFWPDTAIEFRRDLIFVSDDPFGADTVTLIGRGVQGPTNADDALQLTREFALHPPYPNPFNAVTTLEFDLPAAANVSLDLYDITGRRVREMLRGEFSAGTHVVNVAMPEASSGLYFAVLRARGETSVQKLMLIR